MVNRMLPSAIKSFNPCTLLIVLKILIILIGSFQIYTLTVNDWISQGKNQYNWSGSIFYVTDSQGFLQEDSFSSIRLHYCNKAHHPTPQDPLTQQQNQTLCLMFQNLYSGGLAYTVFNLLNLSAMVLVFISLILSLLYRNLPFWIILGSSLMMIFAFFGFFIMLICFKISFVGNCDQVFLKGEDEAQPVCSELGGFLALIIFGLSELFSIGGIYAGYWYHRAIKADIKKLQYQNIMKNQSGDFDLSQPDSAQNIIPNEVKIVKKEDKTMIDCSQYPLKEENKIEL